MSRPFEVKIPLEQAYLRSVLFAVELFDAVTLSRISKGVEVIADGLKGAPIVNASGYFVWQKEDIGPLRGLSIDPGILPYESVNVPVDKLKIPPVVPPLTTIELPPRVDYVFAVGTTGVRGTLIEERVLPPVPVQDANVHLQWLDEDGLTWHDAPTVSHTNAKGDFVSILRLGSTEVPSLDVQGELTVRLHAERSAGNERHSVDLKIVPGRVVDPSILNELKLAWDEMQL